MNRPSFPPRSLAVRLFLLLLAGVLAAVFITTTLALRERDSLVRSFREQALAERVADFLHLLAALPPAQRVATVEALPSGLWRIEPVATDPAEPPEPSSPFAAALAEAAGPGLEVESAWRNRRRACRVGETPCSPTRALGAVVRFADGQRMRIEGSREPPPPRPPRGAEFLGHLAILAALLAVVAWFAVRLVLQPVRQLAEAAEAFGRDPDGPPLDESGPSEVRLAAQTFNRMRGRLRAHIEERTRILAAITHDLKTPLTRMRLRLEQCEDERLRVRLAEDVASMRGLVNEGLELARSLDAGSPPQAVDLGALLESLCEDATDAGGVARFTGPEGALVHARPEALRRAFLNLIDNALKYGGQAEVEWMRDGANWRVTVRDKGPGIPARHLDAVLQPFFRLESSRSRETGGTGLGLPIAVNLLAAQGGRLSLSNHPQGGLEARVELPGFSPAGRAAEARWGWRQRRG
jgi:signal transduction histidine kinase